MLSNLSVNLVLKSIAKNEKKNKNIYFENHDQKVTRASKKLEPLFGSFKLVYFCLFSHDSYRYTTGRSRSKSARERG